VNDYNQNEYLRGLRAAIALCYAKPTAFAFSAAAEIKELIDAEEARLAPVVARRKQTRAAIDYKRPVRVAGDNPPDQYWRKD
jgi:hypothetical protein